MQNQASASRQLSGSIAENLPIDIWHECWSHCELPELRTLTVVCPLFRNICQPALFRTLLFAAPYPESIKRRNWEAWSTRLFRSADRFRAIASSVHATQVRNWQFHGSKKMDLRETFPTIQGIVILEHAYKTAVRSFASVLPQFSNLQVLSMSRLDIDATFLEALATLANLEVLGLDHCNMVCRRLQPPLRLRKFHSLGYGSHPRMMESAKPPPSPIEILSPQKLETLVMDDLINTTSYYASFNTLGVFDDLTELAICIPTGLTISFLSFLDNCPQLKCLMVMDGPPLEDLPPSLPSSACPLLTNYDGPISLAKILIPGRPVEVACLRGHIYRLADYSEITSTLEGVSRSTGPLHRLTIPAVRSGLDIFNLIHSLFPFLQTLRLWINDPVVHSADRNVVNDDPLSGWDSDSSSDIDADPFLESSDGESDSDDDTSESTSDADSLSNSTLSDPDRPFNGNIYRSPGLKAPEPGEVTEILVDEKGLPVRAANTFVGMMDWLALGHARLPPGIEVLDIRQWNSSDWNRLSLPEQRGMIAELTRFLPRLKSMLFGCHEYQWYRGVDGTWVEPDITGRW